MVDTPPTRNALDLLDAPRRLTRFLENRLFRALLHARPGPTCGSCARGRPGAAADHLEGGRGRDRPGRGAFFQAFEGMEEGFRIRADRRAASCWSGPGDRLRPGDLAPPRRGGGGRPSSPAGWPRPASAVDALVVNRVHPTFAAGRRPPRHVPRPGSDLGALVENLAQLRRPWTEREEAAYAELVARVAPAPVGRVPLLGSDVHDLDGLGLVADHASSRPPAGAAGVR